MNYVKKRNVALAIIFSIITCGLYLIYWEICLVNDTNEVCHDREAKSGGIVFLLSLITCNIYWLYWLFKAGEKIDTAKSERGMLSSERGLVFLLLTIFGLGIVALAILQNDINNLAENDTAAYY